MLKHAKGCHSGEVVTMHHDELAAVAAYTMKTCHQRQHNITNAQALQSMHKVGLLPCSQQVIQHCDGVEFTIVEELASDELAPAGSLACLRSNH
jgi:TRAP-type mannitol/chloroaromatic compound transport system substrate-binding protein